jgi:vacuolar-type H+-ATPase catalytic subunit A/Vma1
MFPHKIFVPFNENGRLTLEELKAEGEYTVDTVIAVARDSRGEKKEFSMQFDWRVK